MITTPARWAVGVCAALACAAAGLAQPDATPAAAPADESGDAVAVEALGPVDILTIATLTPDQGGLSRDLWDGVTAGVARRLMQLAPVESESLAASELVALVLRSGGAAPQGGADREALGLARLTALYRAGFAEDVARILSGASGVLSDPDYAALSARARFLSGDSAGACRLVQAARGPQTQSFWARARSACFALAGELAAAELTLTVARDLGAENVDAEFDAWIARATGVTVNAVAPPRDAIELALALHAGGPVGADAAASVSLPGATALAADTRAPASAQLTAAHRAARAGALDAATLERAFARIPAPPNATGSAGLAAAAQSADGALRHAYAHQALTAAAGPAAAAEAIAAALELSVDARDFLVLAQVYEQAIANLPRTRETVVFAPVLAEAAAAAERPDIARALLEAQAAPPGAPTALVPVEDDSDGVLAPVLPADDRAALEVLIVAADAQASGDDLRDAVVARMETAATLTQDERAAAERDALLLWGLGARNTSDLRAVIEAAAAGAPPLDDAVLGALLAMEAAADAGATGEVALHGARVLDLAGPAHPVAAARAARALWRAGLDGPARAVVVEAILAARRTAPVDNAL